MKYINQINFGLAIIALVAVVYALSQTYFGPDADPVIEVVQGENLDDFSPDPGPVGPATSASPQLLGQPGNSVNPQATRPRSSRPRPRSTSTQPPTRQSRPRPAGVGAPDRIERDTPPIQRNTFRAPDGRQEQAVPTQTRQLPPAVQQRLEEIRARREEAQAEKDADGNPTQPSEAARPQAPRREAPPPPPARSSMPDNR